MRGSTSRALSSAATALALVVAGCGLLAAGPASARDKDCSDFADQRDAQIYFLDHGGPEADPDDLDRDNDGIACDSNPCPCYKGSEPPGNPPSEPPKIKTVHTTVRLLALAPGQAITGELVRAAVAVRPRRVRHVVLERLAGTHWRRVTAASTGAGGRHTFRLRTPAGRTAFRARVTALRAGHKRFTARTSSRRTLLVQPQHVRLSLSRHRALRGARIGLTVRAAPARPGRRIVVQRQRPGHPWVQVARGREGRLGRVDLRDTAGVVGAFDYRALVLPAAGAHQVRSASQPLTVRTPDLPPPAPDNLSAVPGDATATLTWDPVDARDLATYQVWEVTDPDLPVQLAGVPSSAVSTTVDGLANDTTYVLTVRAVDRAGHVSADSAPVTVTPTASPPAAPGAVG